MTLLNGVEDMHRVKETIEFDENGMIIGRAEMSKIKSKVKKDEEKED